jgi:prevent-host-death family protein
MTEMLALAEVKAHLSQLVSRVNSQHDRVTVTVHGRPSAVLLAVDDLESLEETIAILSTATHSGSWPRRMPSWREEKVRPSRHWPKGCGNAGPRRER